MATTSLFETLIYKQALGKAGLAKLNKDLLLDCYKVAEYDKAGQKWSVDKFSGGYTSYSSLARLFEFNSTFAKLRDHIDSHVAKFCNQLGFREPLSMSGLWINIVPTHTYHGLHLHPLSVLSGTYYLKVLSQSGNLKFEDPRLGLFMNRPVSRKGTPFHEIKPKVGDVVLFESWIRHEVCQNRSSQDRVSLSFNYST